MLSQTGKEKRDTSMAGEGDSEVLPAELTGEAVKANALVQAAKSGDLEQVQSLVEAEGLDVSQAASDGGAGPLHWAALHNHVSVVEYLLGFVDVDNESPTRQTPLHWVLPPRFPLRVQFRSSAESFMLPPLAFQASRAGSGRSVVALIRGGADVNKQVFMTSKSCHCCGFSPPRPSQDTHGLAAVHWAAQEGHLEVIQLLFLASADMNLKVLLRDCRVRTTLPLRPAPTTRARTTSPRCTGPFLGNTRGCATSCCNRLAWLA